MVRAYLSKGSLDFKGTAFFPGTSAGFRGRNEFAKNINVDAVGEFIFLFGW